MIADRDIYADKNGKITDDPNEYAFQVAVAGVNLDERVARRFGIKDMLVSVNEPNAVRRVTGRSAASVVIKKADDEQIQTEPEPKAETPEVTAPEPKAEKAIAEKPAKKAEAKKGEKKK